MIQDCWTMPVLTDEQIVEIRDEHLPNQGERFDCIAFARAILAAKAAAPIDMVLHCPKCGLQHIDAPDLGSKECVLDSWPADAALKPWANPPHCSHLCHGCGTIWRPADAPTNGVAAIKTKGKADNWDGSKAALASRPAGAPAEPTAWQGIHEPWDLWIKKPSGIDVRPLYAVPPPAPAPATQEPKPVSICQIEAINAGGAYPRSCPTCGITGKCAKGLPHPFKKAAPPQPMTPEQSLEAARAAVREVAVNPTAMSVAKADAALEQIYTIAFERARESVIEKLRVCMKD